MSILKKELEPEKVFFDTDGYVHERNSLKETQKELANLDKIEKRDLP